MADVHQPLIDALRTALATHGDATQAPAMQAYMKSALPFFGVPATLRRRLQSGAVKAWPCTSTLQLGATMQALWLQATHREERYAAMELARVGRHSRLLGLELLPLYQAMIVDGAWWDFCDDISGTALAALLRAHPAELKPVLRAWAQGDAMWLRRAALLVQRGFRAHEIDVPLLYDCITPSLGEARFAREFFIRKGMGWALRERSYTAPDEVRTFCHEHAAQLSPLTVREALKALRRRGSA